MTVISSDRKNKERLCCLFQGVSPGNSKRNQPDIQGRTQFILHIENNGKSFCQHQRSRNHQKQTEH